MYDLSKMSIEEVNRRFIYGSVTIGTMTSATIVSVMSGRPNRVGLTVSAAPGLAVTVMFGERDKMQTVIGQTGWRLDSGGLRCFTIQEFGPVIQLPVFILNTSSSSPYTIQEWWDMGNSNRALIPPESGLRRLEARGLLKRNCYQGQQQNDVNKLAGMLRELQGNPMFKPIKQ